MPPKCFESEVESFLEGSHGDRTHNKQRADHHTVTPLCGTLLRSSSRVSAKKLAQPGPTSGTSAKKLAQHATRRRFWAIFRAQGELFRARARHQTKQGELFRAQDPARGDFATNDTSAATDAGQHETTITTARP